MILSQPQHEPLTRVVRLSRIGVWASTLALGLGAIAIAILASRMIFGPAEDQMMLLRELGIEAHVSNITLSQAAVGALFWFCVDLLGLVLLWQVRQLFHGFLRGGVFSAASALRLRRVGVILMLMGPVSVISEVLGGMIISFWHTGNSVHGSLSIDDADIYALVIGLVITAVSHIMLEAMRLSEENQAFV